MKKIIVFLLCLFMFSSSFMTVFADVDYVQAEESIPLFVPDEEDFLGGVLIVTIKKEYSYPNKTWDMSSFGNPSNVTSFIDITASNDETVIASNMNNVNFRQIFEFYLDTANKQTAIDVANVIATSPYVYSVGVNNVYDINEEPRLAEDESETNSIQSRNGMVSAEQFVNNDRAITNDPYIASQYSIFTTHTNRAWAITKGSPSVVVGVIDSGVDPIPDLVDNLVPGYDLTGVTWQNQANIVQEDYYDADPFHHGTLVASVIASKQNSEGISGIAPEVKVMPLRVHGGISYNALAMVRAFSLAQTLQLPIICMSLNTYDSYTSVDGIGITPSATPLNYGWLAAMMNYSGLIVNSAANNAVFMASEDDPPVDVDELDPPIYPGKFKDDGIDNLIVVGSVNEYNEWAVSNWGDEYVDLMAPGEDVMVAYREDVYDEDTFEYLYTYDDYLEMDGSAISAPMVAGAAALLLSYDSTLTTAQLKNIILSNVTYVPELANRCATSGVLNVYEALLSIGPAMYDYCVSFETTADNVGFADGITVEFPADQVLLTDIYVDTEVCNIFMYDVDVDFEAGEIELYFGSSRYEVYNAGTVVFELWFSAPANSIDDKFAIVNGGFDIDVGNNPLRGNAFLLGDLGKAGNLDSMLMWMDFHIPSGRYYAILDVNRDLLLNNDDKVRAQQYLAGEIKSLFYQS